MDHFPFKIKRFMAVFLVICMIFVLVFPVSVLAAESPLKVTAISASQYFALALKSNGSVWGWGSNSFGELGDGSTISANVPVPVKGLSGVAAVAAGGAFSLALKTDGSVWSWGYNGEGQLGDGTQDNRTTPVQVQGLDHIVAISAGINHSLALKNDGTVWAWGSNLKGSLGLGKDIILQTVPKPVSGLTNVSSIEAGYGSSYAIKQDGTLWAWGLNDEGQLGVGSMTNEFLPVQLSTLNDVQSISAGNNGLALKKDGTVWQWGQVLGSNEMLISLVKPEPVPGLNNVASIANGYRSNLAIKSDGTAWVWGYNAYDGTGPRIHSDQPRQVAGLQGISTGFTGNEYFLAQSLDGTVWAWGYNGWGVLGDGTTESKLSPIKSLVNNEINKPFVTSVCFFGGLANPVYNLDSTILVVNLSSRMDPATVTQNNVSITDEQGHYVDFSLTKGDTFFQLHFTQSFTLGGHYTLRVNNLADIQGNFMEGPYDWTFTGILPEFVTPSDLSAGGEHSLALKAPDVYAWGDNSYGQLGDGTIINRLAPVKIPNFSPSHVFAGGNFSLASFSDGSVAAWGNNNHGQLGDGTQTNHSTPVKIPGLTHIMGLAAGDQHSLALQQDGTVLAWGDNSFGQLGDGTYISRSTPVQIAGLSHVVYIAAGGTHSLAVKDDGTVWAWGDNVAGQLGNGTMENSLTPVQVQGLTEVKTVSAGFEHSLALKKDHTLWAWGNNNQGQLGDETTIGRSLPVHVLNNITLVDAGYAHNLAKDSNGAILVWGSNTFDQLGDDSERDYTSTPQKMNYLSYVLTDSFSAGGAHSASRVMSYPYRIAAWGFNFSGQLGDGSTYHRTIPATWDLPYEGGYYRLSGQDRVATSIQVSQEGWNYGADAVILARSDDFPDALTGAPLAYAVNAPILLTDSKVLTPATEEEIARLQPRRIYILGSSGAISQTIEDTLSKKYKILRLGGTDRYDTAAKIARYLQDLGFATTGKAVVAYGENFPDALAVSSLAAYRHLPILLSETNQLPAPTQEALATLQVRETIIVGGTGVLSQKIADLLPKPIRYWGKDRYETALAVAQKMSADTGLIYIATGENFPDALAGSGLAARTNSPILLVNQNFSPAVTAYLASSNQKPLNTFILGGESIVPDSVLFDLALNE